jgi:hypothetical protein
VTIPAGRGLGNYDTANTTYYFAPGIHTLGTNVNDQIQMGPNDWYVGERSGGKRATVDGPGANNYAFVSQTGDPDWIEYLRVPDFVGAYAIGEPNITGAATNQTIEYDTVQDNYPGSGLELGTNAVAKHDCLTHHGNYGLNAFSEYGVSRVTSGPSNLTVGDNEITYNNQCNYEDVPAGETIEDNYYAENFDVAVFIEITYNALIEDDRFVGNGWGAGACGPALGPRAIPPATSTPPFISRSPVAIVRSTAVGVASTRSPSRETTSTTTGTGSSSSRPTTGPARRPTTPRRGTAPSSPARLPTGARAEPPRLPRITPMMPTRPEAAGRWTFPGRSLPALTTTTTTACGRRRT